MESSESNRSNVGAVLDSEVAKVTLGAPKPGPETAVIKRFTRSARWRGQMPPKGPGAPALPTHGQMTCKWFANGWWQLCDIEDNIGTGSEARQWTAHWISGWDSGHKEYRGFIFDSDGTSSAMRGRLEGTKLIYESMDDCIMHGVTTRLRFTFDSSHPEGIDFTAERLENGKWILIENEVHVAT